MMCTCGQQDNHRIARRVTADGHDVLFYSDGSVYGCMGIGRYGSRPRNADRVEVYLRAAWLAAGEVCLYDQHEVRLLVVTARRAVQQITLQPLEYLRMSMAAGNRAPLRPSWTTLETDRNGRPLVQCWVLPRMRWPGLAIWRQHGRYEVVFRIEGSRGTYQTTGMFFRSLAGVQEYLDDYQLCEGTSRSQPPPPKVVGLG